MGMLMSLMGGKGVSSSQMLNVGIGSFLNQFIEKDIKNFDSFHVAILDLFNTINMALPGKHYDVPPHDKIEELFEQWEEAEQDQGRRKEIFIDFMVKYVNLRNVDESMIITGIVAPPAAMVVKRTGQTMPQLKVMKAIPDVVFVPTATLLALITVKVSRRFLMGKIRDGTFSQLEGDREHIPHPGQEDSTQPKSPAKPAYVVAASSYDDPHPAAALDTHPTRVPEEAISEKMSTS